MDPRVEPEEGQRYRLRDGREVLVRPVGPEARLQLEEGYRELSPRSRRLRFVSAPGHLSRKNLDYLTHVDQVQHLAWGALEAEDPRHGVGIVRCVRDPADPSVAEPALVVADAYQGVGLGTLLFAVLAREARARGVETFRCLVLTDNAVMRAILDQVGAVPTRSEGSELWLDMPLPEDPADYPDTPSGRVFRAVGLGQSPPV